MASYYSSSTFSATNEAFLFDFLTTEKDNFIFLTLADIFLSVYSSANKILPLINDQLLYFTGTFKGFNFSIKTVTSYSLSCQLHSNCLYQFNLNIEITAPPTSLLISSEPLIFVVSVPVTDLSKCLFMDEISYYRDATSKINFDNLNMVSRQSANIFEPTDPFFVDKCVSFSEGDRDYSLTKRNNELLIDPNEVCLAHQEWNCKVKDYDNNGIVYCTCEINDRPVTVVVNENYAVYLCLDKFLTQKTLYNSGFWLLSCLFIILNVASAVSLICSKRVLVEYKLFDVIRNDCLLKKDEKKELVIDTGNIVIFKEKDFSPRDSSSQSEEEKPEKMKTVKFKKSNLEEIEEFEKNWESVDCEQKNKETIFNNYQEKASKFQRS